MELKFFVYGTLKKGFGNHGCAGSPDKIEEAFVIGKMRAGGIPFVKIPVENQINLGSDSPATDAKNLEDAKSKYNDNFIIPGDFNLVKGEVFTYEGDAEYLKSVTARMDSLEGFDPRSKNSHIGYRRYVTLTTDGTPVMIYHSDRGYGEELGKPGDTVEYGKGF